MTLLPSTDRGFSSLLLPTAKSVEENSSWMATIFSIPVLSTEQLDRLERPILGSKMLNEEMTILCLGSCSFLFTILLSSASDN
ncbi:hypothetical protein TNCT_728971 [Trichonephila clavata]|uniref:Uncharacterized protein n=1 Tax=Trichonephila clavata TaxID=2740835 RepID=A0A8X6GUW2_TRICU|nr:hypothetical protein TNCT_728971 [Trichonephila clavata]